MSTTARRLHYTYAEYLALDGASYEAIDRAVESYGFAMGPFAVSDLAGLDIAWAMRKRRAATRERNERYVEVADRLCEQGRLGCKAGRGWYLYANDSSKRVPDTEVEALFAAERAAKGDRKSTRLNSSHSAKSRMPSSA